MQKWETTTKNERGSDTMGEAITTNLEEQEKTQNEEEPKDRPMKKPPRGSSGAPG